MKSTLLFFPLLCFLFLLAIAHPVKADHWELELDKDGIRVYTQTAETSPYKQVKVTTTVNASMADVMKILLTFNRYKSWMNQVEESYLIQQSEGAYYVFILENAAWPMQNRYHVSKLEVQEGHLKSKIDFKSVPNYIEKRTDAIQLRQFEGYWALESRSDQQCTLEFVVIQHPGGHVPPWLANFHAVENPFRSVANLKDMAENMRIRP